MPLSRFTELTCAASRKARLATYVVASIALLSSTAHAEYLGLIAGREATPARTSDLSVELGFVTGDLGEVEYNNIAARVNYRLSPEVVLTGTAGVAEFGKTNGVPLGLGVMYHLSKQRISQEVELAARASYHFGDFSIDETDGDLSSLALEALISGAQPLMSNGLSWYSNISYHRITVDFGKPDSTNELGLGAGLILPTGLGEAYVGFDHIDEFSFGIGIRYFVQ